MTIKQALLRAIQSLQKITKEPHLDAEVLLSFTLKKRPACRQAGKIWLYAHSEKKLKKTEEIKFKKLIAQRKNGTPVAYLVEHKEFFDLDFMVDKNVLIPCPETELLVEEVLKSIPNSKFQILNSITIADIGTGCGNIAITLAKHLPLAKIYAVDISKNALKVARRNAKKHKTEKKIIFLNGNLLEPLPKKVNIITANLPYIPSQKAKRLNHSPQIALDGGKDGLKFYQSLLENAADYLRPNGKIFLEINFNQAEKIKKIIKKYFPQAEIEIKKDLAGLNRLVIILC
ncbi:MAG: peptide chain release factor N(5)-glutamine methyltransferase [Patescibacteria group bacterium]|nr:peptide chain release factor N(5)-glutamine methyltransferase [Patescibacteria group bacterium]